jgi:hypothetical protein
MDMAKLRAGDAWLVLGSYDECGRPFIGLVTNEGILTGTLLDGQPFQASTESYSGRFLTRLTRGTGRVVDYAEKFYG